MDSEQAVREGSRLRLLAVGHITDHKTRFSESWAPVEAELPEERAYQEALLYEDEIGQVARKAPPPICVVLRDWH